jgi:hypothetical protein
MAQTTNDKQRCLVSDSQKNWKLIRWVAPVKPSQHEKGCAFVDGRKRNARSKLEINYIS